MAKGWEATPSSGDISTNDQFSVGLYSVYLVSDTLAKFSGVRTEAPGNPVPPPLPVFLQLTQVSNDPKMKAVASLREAAKAAHSHALERLAVEVAAHLKGPFDQVNNMIEKMILRLMER